MAPGDKIHRRALGMMAQSAALAGPVELPEGAEGMRVYGTGLPKEGVYVSKEEMEGGIVAVDSGPPRSAWARNGSLW
jgi:hypothetical protein